MLVFVVISAIANIALGYALAVYVTRHGERTRQAALSGAQEPHDPETPAVISHAELPPVSNTATPLATPIAATALPEDETEALAPDGPLHGPDVEQELLAGIEEFRNQLSQIKLAEVSDTAAAPTATVTATRA